MIPGADGAMLAVHEMGDPAGPPLLLIHGYFSTAFVNWIRYGHARLLADRGFVRLSAWLTQRHGTGIGRDDLIDACACAVAARDSTSRLGGDEVDIRGLRMEINY